MTTDNGVKIFGIGLNKTGTISLHAALEALGYRSLHWGGPPTREAVQRALREGRPLLENLGDYDAFSDIWGLSVRFDVLDKQYPGSKFILTTRSLESWLDSRQRHVVRNNDRRVTGEYDGTFLEVDLPAWRRDYLRHHARVFEYFADRPPEDLLIMDITRSDGYELLCPFLGIDLPEDPFPWRHRNIEQPAL